MCHNLVKDLHVFGSYVTGHLPHEHPHVVDTTHDDRDEGVFLGNDLTTPNFRMYSFRAKKVMILSDPNHWDHILPFMQPRDVPHRIVHSLPLNYARQGSSPLLPILPIQGRRCKNCPYQIELTL
jgi:hypothetical protein